MTNRSCPYCHQRARLLDSGVTSPFAQAVDYYRCDPCAYVWWQSKTDAKASPVSVTVAPATIPRHTA